VVQLGGDSPYCHCGMHTLSGLGMEGKRNEWTEINLSILTVGSDFMTLGHKGCVPHVVICKCGTAYTTSRTIAITQVIKTA